MQAPKGLAWCPASYLLFHAMLKCLIYISLSFLVFLAACGRPNTITNNKYNARLLIVLLVLLSTIFLVTAKGFPLPSDAPLHHIDTPRYINEFKQSGTRSLSDSFHYGGREPLTTLLFWSMSRVSDSGIVFVAFVWLLSFLLLIVGLSKIFSSWQLLFVFFTYLNFFIYYSYGAHAIRQGFSVLFILIALCLMVSKDYKWFYLCLFAAPLFHVAALPFVVALLLLRIFKIDLGVLVSIWIAFALLFVTGYNESLFGIVSKYYEPIGAYSSAEALMGCKSNRLEFLLFSALFLLIVIILYNTWAKDKENYKLILNAYILLNIIFIMFGFIGYSYRLASYSWYLIPILIWFPILKPKTYKPYISSILVVAVFITGLLTGVVYYMF